MKKYELRLIDNKLQFKSRIGITPEIKELGFRWNPNIKYWEANKAYIYIGSLFDLYDQNDIEIDFECQKFISELHGFELKDVVVPKETLSLQYDAISYLLSSDKNGSILCLSPGTGKTYISLIAASIAQYKNVLIVCPKKIIGQWIRQAKKWLNKDINNCYGKSSEPGWCVTNYDTLVNKLDEYTNRKYDLLIVDESINIKHGKPKTITEEINGVIKISKIDATKRFGAIEKVRKLVNKVWLLSGSPADKNAADLHSQLKLIDPKVFGSYWRFVNRYCVVEVNYWGTKIKGTDLTRDIRGDLRDYVLVINKKDVLNLPEAIYETVYLDLNEKQRTYYTDLVESFIVTLQDSPHEYIEYSDQLAINTKLHQIASGLANVIKTDDSVKSDYIEDMLKGEQIQTPCLIWVHYRKNAEALYKRLQKHTDKVGILLGGSKDADQIIENAENSKFDYFILSLESGKHGLSLQNFYTMIYYDLNYRGDTFFQSGERIERIGLDHSPTIITLIAKDTIDEVIIDSLVNKSETIAKISKYDLIILLKRLGRNNES